MQKVRKVAAAAARPEARARYPPNWILSFKLLTSTYASEKNWRERKE
jgi:hypothetical protein